MAALSGPEFVSTDELAGLVNGGVAFEEAELGKVYASLAAAYSLVASELGTDELAERVATQRKVIPRASTLLELTDGPLADISNLTSVTVNGTALDLSDIERFNSWCLIRIDAAWVRLSTVELTFLAGYRVNSDGSTTMPERVRQAILATAGDAYFNPVMSQKKIMERIGDYQYQKAGAALTAADMKELTIPASAILLLRDYKKTR